MPGPLLITGDTIMFVPEGAHICPPLLAPLPLVGSASDALVNMMPICLLGDELPPGLDIPLPYLEPPYTIPGMGLLDFEINPLYISTSIFHGTTPVLINALIPFTVKFNVTVPAMMPPPGPAPPIPDANMAKEFIVTYLPSGPPVAIEV